jgi:hypothetical protein
MQDFADRRTTTHTTQADLRWRLFAFRRHGTMRSGVDAFIALWDDVPKYRWAARLVRAFGITGVTQCSTTEPGSRSWRRGIGVPASRPATAPRPSAWWDKVRIQQIAGAATAFLVAGLAPALVMAALWHTTKIAPMVFAFTFAIALGHAILLGLLLFLVFRSKGWINVMSCVVFGFAVGAAPAGILTWPMHHPESHTSALVDGVPMIINGVITAAGWVSYVKPLIYFGSLGALGGFAFWVALIWSGTVGKAAAAVDRSRASGAELRHPVRSALPKAE